MYGRLQPQRGGYCMGGMCVCVWVLCVGVSSTLQSNVLYVSIVIYIYASFTVFYIMHWF